MLLLAALTVSMALMGAFFLLPLLYFTPVPLAIIVYRHGYRPGIVTAVLTVVLVGAAQRRLFGNVGVGIDQQSWQIMFIVAMTALVTIGLIGIVIGGAWREGVSRWQTLWLSTAAAIFPALGVWFMLKTVQGIDAVQVIFDSWLTLTRTLVAESVAGGLPVETADALFDMILETEQTFPLVKRLLPSVLFVTGLIGSYVNSGLAAHMLLRDERPAPAIQPFAAWKFPWPFAFAFMFGYGLTFVAKMMDNVTVAFVGQNLVIAAGLVCMVQGAAVVVFGLKSRNVGPFIQLVAVLLLLWWVPPLATWLGALDTWINFRKVPVVK